MAEQARCSASVPFLSVKDLYVQYTSAGETIHAVNGVSLTLERGQTLALVGETGAGKTTIAKSILRILPDRAAKVMGGSITLEGEDLLLKSPQDMRKVRGMRISMVFQDPMTSLNPIMRVGDQVAEVIRRHLHCSKKEAYERAGEMFENVGIRRERLNDFPHQFSGGMKQRVVIAIALACNPQLLLADEPTSALDVTIQAQVLDMMKDLKEKLGTALIMITHDLGVVAKICDSVAVMYAGKIVEYGTLRDIFNTPKHPYTEGLFNSLPNIRDRKAKLKPIPGLMIDPTALPSGCAFEPRCGYAIESCKSPCSLKQLSDTHSVLCSRYEESSFQIEMKRGEQNRG